MKPSQEWVQFAKADALRLIRAIDEAGETFGLEDLFVLEKEADNIHLHIQAAINIKFQSLEDEELG